MSSEKLILFDLANQQGTAWSLNPWRSKRPVPAHQVPTAVTPLVTMGF